MPRTRRSALRATAGSPFASAALLGAEQHTIVSAPAQAAHQPQSFAPTNLLVVSATTGYRHDSIPAGIAAVQRLVDESGQYTLTVLPETPDLAALTPELLAQQHAVLFLNTSGELPLDETQKIALLDFVRNGGGFCGAHAATDTFYTWPEYGELIGAYFKEHPWTQPVTITVDDASHPTTQPLPTSFGVEDEIYTFRTNPRLNPNTRVLMSLEPTSVGLPPSAAPDLPLVWTSTYGSGRVLYNALGHFDSVWQHPIMTTHLRHALAWLGGLPPPSA